MIDPGLLSLVASGALLFVALGFGVRVLVGILREGLDRSRKRRAGEIERYTEDPIYDRDPPDPDADGDTSTCPQCGAENDARFDHCRECAAPLGPGR